MLQTILMRTALACTVLALACAPALASSFAGSSAGASSAGTSGSTSGDDKVVLEAREDAASFVASNGRIRSARLQAALRSLRERYPQARTASDLQLAQAILAL